MERKDFDILPDNMSGRHRERRGILDDILPDFGIFGKSRKRKAKRGRHSREHHPIQTYQQPPPSYEYHPPQSYAYNPPPTQAPPQEVVITGLI